MTFESPEAFYADRPERRDSPETDYGEHWWTAGSSFPKWRVSWIAATGEFYAVCVTPRLHHALGGTVELLGVRRTLDGADAAMEGWADLRYAELRWVRDRLAKRQRRKAKKP